MVVTPPPMTKRVKKSKQPLQITKDLGRWKPADDLLLINAVLQVRPVKECLTSDWETQENHCLKTIARLKAILALSAVVYRRNKCGDSWYNHFSVVICKLLNVFRLQIWPQFTWGLSSAAGSPYGRSRSGGTPCCTTLLFQSKKTRFNLSAFHSLSSLSPSYSFSLLVLQHLIFLSANWMLSSHSTNRLKCLPSYC